MDKPLWGGRDRDRDRVVPAHRHFDRSEAEWRNLPAEWGC